MGGVLLGVDEAYRGPHGLLAEIVRGVEGLYMRRRAGQPQGFLELGHRAGLDHGLLHVIVGQARHHHAFPHVVESGQEIPVGSGGFVLHVLGGPGHFSFEFGAQAPEIPFQEMLHAVGQRRVVGPRDLAGAGGGALPGVEVEAGLYLFLVERLGQREIPPAAAEVYELDVPKVGQQFPERLHLGVRPEIAPAVADFPAGEEQSGEIAAGQLDIRIGFRVLPHLVEEGLQFVDQLALGEQGFSLAGRGDIVDGAYQRHEVRYLAAGVGRVLPEILRHALAQVLGLADVKHRAGRVAHQVNSGAGRQM